MPKTVVTQQATVVLHGRIAPCRSDFLVQVPTHVVTFTRQVTNPCLVHVVPNARWSCSETENPKHTIAALYRPIIKVWNRRLRHQVVRHNVTIPEPDPSSTALDRRRLDYPLVPGRRWDVTVVIPDEQRYLFADGYGHPVEIDLVIEYELAYEPTEGLAGWTVLADKHVRCRKKAVPSAP